MVLMSVRVAVVWTISFVIFSTQQFASSFSLLLPSRCRKACTLPRRQRGSAIKSLNGNEEEERCSNWDSSHDEVMSPEEREAFGQVVEMFLSESSDGTGISEGGNSSIGKNTTDFPSAMVINPFRSSLRSAREKSSSLYSDDELYRVLSLHRDLEANTCHDVNDNKSESLEIIQGMDAMGPLGNIQKAIAKTLVSSGDNASSSSLSSFGPSNTRKFQVEIDRKLKERSQGIKAIASDVDGTILTRQMSVHPRTRLAIKRAIQSASSWEATSDSSSHHKPKGRIQHFFPATGKSRMGALYSLGVKIGTLVEQNCGGVYLQGLYCVDRHGTVVFEKKLNRLAIGAAEMLARETSTSIVGYDGDQLYTTNQTDIVIHLHEHYGEPLPVLLPKKQGSGESVRSLESHDASMHKLLLLDDDIEKLTHVVRPRLEELAKQYGACVTQALPTMLELLPEGCSKALGVEKLCQALDIDPRTELLAIGDAENDAGMLRMACIGVAVGNASPPARDASDVVLEFTNDQGGAGYAMEMFALDDVQW